MNAVLNFARARVGTCVCGGGVHFLAENLLCGIVAILAAFALTGMNTPLHMVREHLPNSKLS